MLKQSLKHITRVYEDEQVRDILDNLASDPSGHLECIHVFIFLILERVDPEEYEIVNWETVGGYVRLLLAIMHSNQYRAALRKELTDPDRL